jgi:hypothetical protein
MTAVTFDTLKFVERLRAAGVPDLQAKAMAEAQIEALGEATAFALATKADVYDIKSELRPMKWMLGFLLALGLANLSLIIRLALTATGG